MRPKGVDFTERDLAIIRRVHELRVLNTSQVAWLFFPSDVLARNRLNRLKKEGLLRSVRPGGPFSRCCWAVGSEARNRFELRPSGFDSTFSIAHQIGLNWIYCGLVGRGETSAKWIKWTDGNGIKYPAADSWIRPDAVIESVRKKTTVMLEYDNGTKTLPRIHENLSNYLSWWQMHPTEHRTLLFYGVQDEARGHSMAKYWADLSEGKSRLELHWALAGHASRILSGELDVPNTCADFEREVVKLRPDTVRMLADVGVELGKMIVPYRLPETASFLKLLKLSKACRDSLE